MKENDWTWNIPVYTGDQPMVDIGADGEAMNYTSLFIPADLLQMICYETNLYAQSMEKNA